MNIKERAKEFRAPACGIDFFNFSTITDNSRRCSAVYLNFLSLLSTSLRLFISFTWLHKSRVLIWFSDSYELKCSLYSCMSYLGIFDFNRSFELLLGRLHRFQWQPTIVCASFDCCGWPFLCFCQSHPLLMALTTAINHTIYNTYISERLLEMRQRMPFIYKRSFLVFIAYFFYLSPFWLFNICSPKIFQGSILLICARRYLSKTVMYCIHFSKKY